ncbi:sensor histidine kinase [Microbacterium sp. B2969]|uniref:Sensor histidine kinase n=1 Tax=Microbacterium alkaliflavum TaxID=3248839 RepID=A0ABW7QDH3_9MICO
MTAATILLILDIATGVVLGIFGAIAWARRPASRDGALMLVTAAVWFLGSFWPPALYLHRGALAHLHLGHPDGRLRRSAARYAVAVAWAGAAVEGVVPSDVGRWFLLVIAFVVAGAAIDQYLHTTGPARRAALPALWAALGFATVLVASAANQFLHWQADLALAITYDVAIASLVGVLLADLLRGAWTDDTLALLVARAGDAREPTALDAELRRALGDPTARLAVWDPRSSAFRDGHGDPVDPEHLPASLRTTPIEEDGVAVAIIVHDRNAAAEDPRLVDGVRAVVRLAVANARLDAEVRARMVEVDAARRTLVEASDAVRSRFARELDVTIGEKLDDVRAQLDLVEQSSGSADVSIAIEQAIGEVDAARSSLLELAHGLSPQELSASGLGGALALLAGRCPVDVTVDAPADRYAASVEAAVYFFCAEALTNIARHAAASHADVTVTAADGRLIATVSDDGRGGADPEAGTGLRGLQDRIEALGGSFGVHSIDGRGTVLTARLPTGDQP